MRNAPRRRGAVFLPLLLVAVTTATAAAAPLQGGRKFAEKPLWVLWHTGFTEQRAMAYIKSVAEQTGIADDLEENLRKEIDKEREETRPVKGAAMFMVKGIIPGVEELEFRAVADDAEFNKIIQERQRMWGGNDVKVTGTGNLKKLEVNRSWQTTKRKVHVTTDENGNERRTVEVVTGDDGKPVMETQSWSRTLYFRLENGVMYEGSFPEIHDMTLPASEALGLGSRTRDEDLYFQANLKQVPKGFKDVFWGMLKAQANSMMQQRDNESAAPYEFRRAASTTGLEFLRTLVFDVESATGWIKLATHDQPVRGRFDVEVRSNSALAKKLKDLGKARSRLPAPEEAALSVRSVWAMPVSFQKMLTTAGPYLRELADNNLRDDDAIAGIHSIAAALEGTGEMGEFESVINFGGTKESGPVLYGALRADKSDRLADGMRALLTYAINEANEPNLPSVEAFDSPGGRRYVRLAFPDMPWPSDLKPDHAYLTSGAGAVWFAIGREDAFEILERRIGERGRRGRSALLELTVDLSRFLDAADPAGLGELGKKLDVEFDVLASAEFARVGGLKEADLPPTRELLEAALAEGGRRMTFALDSDSKGFFVRGQIDEPLARYLTARYMSTVNRVMVRQRAMMEERMRERQEELEKANRARAAAAAKAKEDTDDDD